MKTHTGIATILILLTSLAASTQLHAQRMISRSISNFNEVVAFGNVEVFITEGDDFSVKLKAFHIASEKVMTEVSGGKLTIKLSSIKREQYARIYVTAPRFREIRAQAGAKVVGENALTGDKVYVSAVAGARVELEVAVNEFEGKASEGGVLHVTGTGTSLKASASNGGELQSLQLDAEHVYVKASVGGVAKVAAGDHLEASAKAGGKVIYLGEPTRQQISTALGGTVVPKD